jgi:hypothetical protein
MVTPQAMPQSRTLYTPVFHPPDPSLSLPSSLSTRVAQKTPSSTVLRLSSQHLHLASLPPDYSPPPSPPLSQARVAKLVQRFRSTGFAWDAMRMGCVRRGYGPVPLSRTANERDGREGDGIQEAGNLRELPLPETEEEWFAWEKQMQVEQLVKRTLEGQQAGIGSAPDEAPEQAGIARERAAKAKQSASTGKEKASTLGFPVVKRAASAVSKKNGAPSRGRLGPTTPPRDSNPLPTSNLPQPQLSPHKSPEHIAEVSKSYRYSSHLDVPFL